MTSQTKLMIFNNYVPDRGPYQICKAPRDVRPQGFSNLICPEGLVHNCFKLFFQKSFLYSIKLRFVAFIPLNKLKSRLCIGLTLNIDLDPAILLIYLDKMILI